MNRPPAFQFYPDDFLAGTFSFTHEERGLLITLLCKQWTDGGITLEEAKLIAGAMAQPSIERVFSKFKVSKKNVLRNAKLERVRHAQNEFRRNRSESGKSGAEKRWHSHGTAMAQPLANDGSLSPSPSPSFLQSLNVKGGGQALHKAGGNGKKLPRAQSALADEFKIALGTQWINDAGKWINRIKDAALFGKCERVLAEVMSAIKESRINTTPAQYAEEIWKEFK